MWVPSTSTYIRDPKYLIYKLLKSITSKVLFGTISFKFKQLQMKKTITWIIIIALIGLSFYLGYRSNEPEPLNPHVKVITDTLYISKPYPETQIIRDTLKPERVTFYLTDSTRIKELELKVKLDSQHYSFIIQGLQERVEVSENFLKLYPRNPKLVEMKLFRDSLNLSVMDILGNVRQEKYNLFLQDYNYNWANGVMGYQRTRYKSQEPRFTNYGGFNYDLIHQIPKIEYQLDFRFISTSFLYLRASQDLLFNERPNLQVGFKMKL